MVVLEGMARLRVGVMEGGVHQGVETGFLSRADRDYRDSEHFLHTVNVDLHAALLYYVHHVESHDDRLSELDEL